MPRPKAITCENDFWLRVDLSSSPDGCWPWTRGCDFDGYGRAWFRPRSRTAHRVAWEYAYGAIPPGLCVLHRCDNPPCCNPAHLFLGTQADNSADKVRKGRQAQGPRARPGRMRRGTEHYAAKLTDADIPLIRARSAAGETRASVAQSFGVSPQLIQGIFKRRIWKHIP